jgi:hypothetical protein
MEEVERLHEARREAQREAAPFAFLNLVALLLVAGLSAKNHWRLLGAQAWWLWLVVAAPLVVLCVRFALGFGPVATEAGRAFRLRALVALGVGTALAVFALVATLTGVGSTYKPSGGQLLASSFAVLLTNVVTFALSFWELDSGGPVSRAVAEKRVTPDFQFPQDENPELAVRDWSPRLLDYAYVALTNATAFSPTDVMPLSARAKMLMAIESTVSLTTVLVVGARAVNILK